jgi:hypothetical protein
MRSAKLNLVLLGLISTILGACSAPETFTEEPTKANLRQIAKAYAIFESDKKRPPRDVAELSDILAGLHAINLGPPAEEVLQSPRDKRPFVIIYGSREDGDAPEAILAYEEQGAEGSRWVLTRGGNLKVLTAEEFGKASFANKHSPATGA